MTCLRADAALIRGLLPPEARPPADADSLFLLYAVLMRAKGEQVTAADVHDAWAAWADNRDPGHTAIVPFDELSRATRREDEPYVRQSGPRPGSGRKSGRKTGPEEDDRRVLNEGRQ